MRKLVASLLLVFSLNASAHGPSYGYYGTGDWFVPLVLGGVVGYLVAQPRTQYQPLPESNPIPEYIPKYRREWIYDAECRCTREVLVQIN